LSRARWPMECPMSESLQTLKYLTDFKCLAADCPDTCCKGWTVLMDQPSYKQLKKAMQRSSVSEAKRFRESVERLPDNQLSNGYASMRLDANGNCNFLDDDGLCHIHSRYGEDKLCYTCSLYPKVFSRRNDVLHMTASLSCPAAARLCLLDAEAGGRVKITTAELPRDNLLGKDYSLAAEGPGAEIVSVITDLFFQFLDFDEVPVASRLFFIAQLAALLSEGYADPEGAGARMAEDIEAMVNAEVLLNLHREFSALQTSPMEAITLAQKFLLTRVADNTAGRLKELLVRIVERYPQEDGGPDDSAARMVRDYQDSVAYWSQHFPERIDTFVLNLCRNYLYYKGYPEFANPLAYVMYFLATLSIIRFLLFVQPQLLNGIENDLAGSDRESALRLLDDTMVDVVQRFYREMQHNAKIVDFINRELAARGMVNLRFAAFLIAA